MSTPSHRFVLAARRIQRSVGEMHLDLTAQADEHARTLFLDGLQVTLVSAVCTTYANPQLALEFLEDLGGALGHCGPLVDQYFDGQLSAWPTPKETSKP